MTELLAVYGTLMSGQSYQELEAWVYVWGGEPRGEPIDDGDWWTWLALRGDR